MEIVDIELNSDLTIQVSGTKLEEDSDSLPSSFEIDSVQILKGTEFDLILYCNSEANKMVKFGDQYPDILETLEELILTKIEDNR